jgi:hypothetical protein
VTINTTPNRAYPWPANDEPVTNGWDAIRDLAVAIDTDVDAIADAAAARVVPWTAYDPRLPGSSPIFLSLSYKARYSIRDKLCEVEIGGHYYPSTAGPFAFALPVAMSPHDYPVSLCVGSCWAYDFSTSQRYAGSVVIDPGATSVRLWSTGTNPWGDTGGSQAPFTWAVNGSPEDSLSLSFRYPVA